jgi:hypothetical protein
MRILFIILMLVSVGCQAQDEAGITRKVVEPDTNKDGKPDTRIETISRDGKKIMMIWSKPDALGKMKVTSRSYMVGGDIVTTETDQDRDGVFESVAVYRPGTMEMEVFTRMPDGAVVPVDQKTLEAHKKQHAAITELWDKFYDETNDSDKGLELLKEAQRKIQEAGEEISDTKK